jgi:serine/threonine protein phosphatase 1
MIIQKFDKNKVGRDFVVGDLHGCFDALRQALANVSFNEATDRLFSVGDLVDRGGQSEESIDWIALPWFHAVRGNHEQMAIGIAAGKHDPTNYMRNGGQWFINLSQSRQQLYAAVFDALPYMIEVKTDAGRVGIVHAEVLHDSWDAFVERMENPLSGREFYELKEIALWGRTRIKSGSTKLVEGLHAL